MSQSRICAVVGAGPGNGLSLGKRFDEAGYSTALLARSTANLDNLKAELPGAHTFLCDVTSPDSIEVAFNRIERDLGPFHRRFFNGGG